jgi:imidazole glycerol-phosphate synthase subunit HisH
MITIIDYQVGNLVSIQNMLARIGYSDVRISSDKADIETAEKLILPGVGHFDYGMTKLRGADFFDALNQRVLESKIPVLGICLGAQLLLDSSEEGSIAGLGWIPGKSKKFDESLMPKGLKIPHMGWGEITVLKKSPLLEGLPQDARFYFVHSYHMECTDPSMHLLASEHGYPFIAGVERDNIAGVQFHPEKSHKYGMALLKNFVTNY